MDKGGTKKRRSHYADMDSQTRRTLCVGKRGVADRGTETKWRTLDEVEHGIVGQTRGVAGERMAVMGRCNRQPGPRATPSPRLWMVTQVSS
jgi:hypothetical protein